MADRIVLAEDDAPLRTLIVDLLTAEGFAVEACASAEAALEAVETGPTDLVITDLVMPGIGGEALLRRVREQRPEINVVVITAFGSVESAITMVRAGAYDYILKPFATDDFLDSVRTALAESRARRVTASTARQPGGPLSHIIGQSTALGRVIEMATRAAGSRHPVLLVGESGTGKELFANAIHSLSGRQAFVPINCGALPETLVEAELFGHERGAFTGAAQSRMGLIEAAHGGTLFLDEISELPPAMQPKLLRALEDHQIRRVGATQQRRSDFRLISASNRDLEQDIRDGRFREDLYWRINVILIPLPALRDRAEDIPLLAEYFLGEGAESADRPVARTISPDAMRRLEEYPWPGNARELRNAILRAQVMATGTEITLADLPGPIQTGLADSPHAPGAYRSGRSLRDIERQHILDVLRQEGGNRSRAANVLGLDRKTLYRKLKEYQLDQSEAGSDD